MKKILLTVGLAVALGSQLVTPQINNTRVVVNNTPIVAQRQVSPTLTSNVQLIAVTITPTPTATPETAGVSSSDGDPSSSDPVQLGEQLAAQRGWTGYEWNDLYSLWSRESGWNAWAWNVSSGAGGIPQALPFSKTGCSLGDTGCQITWGLGYIANRYGDPASAWNHEEIYNWY